MTVERSNAKSLLLLATFTLLTFIAIAIVSWFGLLVALLAIAPLRSLFSPEKFELRVEDDGTIAVHDHDGSTQNLGKVETYYFGNTNTVLRFTKTSDYKRNYGYAKIGGNKFSMTYSLAKTVPIDPMFRDHVKTQGRYKLDLTGFFNSLPV